MSSKASVEHGARSGTLGGCGLGRRCLGGTAERTAVVALVAVVLAVRDVVRLVAVVLVAVEVVAVLAARVDAVLAAFFATSVFSTDSTACADWLL